jgi:hypothetical protein
MANNYNGSISATNPYGRMRTYTLPSGGVVTHEELAKIININSATLYKFIRIYPPIVQDKILNLPKDHPAYGQPRHNGKFAHKVPSPAFDVVSDDDTLFTDDQTEAFVDDSTEVEPDAAAEPLHAKMSQVYDSFQRAFVAIENRCAAGESVNEAVSNVANAISPPRRLAVPEIIELFQAGLLSKAEANKLLGL